MTVGEEAEVDLEQIHHVIGASGRVSFGKPEALLELLGVLPGAVTVFGLINDEGERSNASSMQGLWNMRSINAHPLVNDATTSIAAGDLLGFVKATGHEPFVLKVAA